MVIKMKARITNMLQRKMVQKLVVIFTTSLLLVIILLSNPFLIMMVTKVPYTELSLTDNLLEKNQPISTPATSTGSHPIKSSPASTNISNKT
nr:female open reading frame [Ortmanniana ligamentina]